MKERGITLVALVITIIVLLILAGVTINLTIGEEGIITQARRSKFVTEIKDIEEQIALKQVWEPQLLFGTVNGILGIESKYNQKVVIENKKLVYNPEEVNKEEKGWLESVGIKPISSYYLIMNEGTKEKFAGQTNIGTIEEFRTLVNEGKFNYNIAYVVENIEIQEENWTPIGTSESNAFNSTFEGNNYMINKLKIDAASDNIGLFGYNKGTIQNVTIKEGNVKTTKGHAGILVGYNKEGILENIKIEGGELTAASNSGGMLGYNNGGTIRLCINSASVKESATEDTGTDKYIALGGIIGLNTETGIVERCYNRGTVKAINSGIGGVVGENSGTIKNCENSGEISATGKVSENIGGIAGWNGNNVAIIENCINSGNITGSYRDVGGITGDSKGNGIIKSCTNTGNILSKNTTGGISGNLSGNCNIEQCTNKGKVEGIVYVGGITGLCTGTTISLCKNEGIVMNSEISDYCTNGGWNTGGITGVLESNGLVEKCINVGDITAHRVAGGICGYIRYGSTVQYCVNKGTIKATRGYFELTKNSTSEAGGIVGDLGIQSNGQDVTDRVLNCYNIGNCDSYHYTGGIASKNADYSISVKNCYNIGKLSATKIEGYATYVGGILGASLKQSSEVLSTSSNNYWLDSCGTNYGFGGVNSTGAGGTNENTIPKTSEELKKLAGTLGEAYKDDTGINGGYPILSWEE